MKKIPALTKCIKEKDFYPFERLTRALWENFLRFCFKFHKPKGVKILDEKWDYLIILDTCRYDEFKKINTLKGKLEKKTSLASNTSTWMRRNFNRDCKDIIYVTANPQMTRVKVGDVVDNFFKIENVWDYGWDEKLKCVKPSTLTKASLDIIKKHPDKRLIIHYIQPHFPFVSAKNNPMMKTTNAVHYFVRNGKLSVDELRKAWRANLKWVMDEVKDNLLPKLSGRSIISADHGELFGEKGLYLHTRDVYIKELIEVPWLIIDSNNKIKKKATISEKEAIKNIDGIKI